VYERETNDDSAREIGMADTPEHSLQMDEFFKERENSQTASQD
jgi:hypothetical protein